MKQSDVQYLVQEYRILGEIEERIEQIKQNKKDYIKSLEKRFRKRCTAKEAAQRLKDFLERYPDSVENKKINQIEVNLRHVIKQFESKKKHIERINNGE